MRARNIALPVSISTDQIMSFEWAKPVATELLIIIMGRPFVDHGRRFGTLKTYHLISSNAHSESNVPWRWINALRSKGSSNARRETWWKVALWGTEIFSVYWSKTFTLLYLLRIDFTKMDIFFMQEWVHLIFRYHVQFIMQETVRKYLFVDLLKFY